MFNSSGNEPRNLDDDDLEQDENGDCFNDPKYFSNGGDDQVKPNNQDEESPTNQAPGLSMDDFLICEEAPESLNQFLERKGSAKKTRFDPKELIQYIEVRVSEPERPEYNDSQFWRLDEMGYDINALLEDYQ